MSRPGHLIERGRDISQWFVPSSTEAVRGSEVPRSWTPATRLCQLTPSQLPVTCR